jgi:hypothetical protein
LKWDTKFAEHRFKRTSVRELAEQKMRRDIKLGSQKNKTQKKFDDSK